jgi:hypothetical protein
LDQSLPTRPWNEVAAAPQTSPFSQGIPNDEFDRRLAIAQTLAHDAGIACLEVDVILRAPVYKDKKTLLSREVIGRTYNLPTVPPSLYAIEEKFAPTIDGLSSITSSGARETLRRSFIDQLNLWQKALSTMEQLVLQIQNDKGVTPAANNLHSKAMAIRSSIPRAADSDLLECYKSKAYLDALPDTIKLMYGIIEDPTGRFTLGGYFYSWNASYLVDVSNSGFGFTLGLRAGDTLLSAAGKEPLTILGLRQLITENLGKKIVVLLKRDGKKESVIMQIPVWIPEEALINKK